MQGMAKKKPPPEPETPPPLRLEWRSPAELAENPMNWRRHPETQTAALADVISEVGWAGACLYNERTKRLIDGHARKSVALSQGCERVPVLVGSWSEEQERKILATLDPLGAMAERDNEALQALLGDLQTDSVAVGALLGALAVQGAEPREPMAPANEPAKEWQGMPSYEHEDKRAHRSLTVHFKDQAALDRFAELVGQKITDATRFLWFPGIEIERFADKRYAADA